MYKKISLLACAALLFCLALPGLATAQKPEDVFVVVDGNWVLKADGSEAPAPYGADFQAGILWLSINPEFNDAVKGLPRGLLLYDAKSDVYSFLPTDEEQAGLENISFSPDRQRMIMACYVNRSIGQLYVYTLPDLKPEKTFPGYSEVHFVDDVRFAFTLFDTRISRPVQVGMLWATTAAIYEPAAEDGYIMLKEATDTENFTVDGVDREKGQIRISVFSVPEEADWEDIDKQESSEITVEIPAAG